MVPVQIGGSVGGSEYALHTSEMKDEVLFSATPLWTPFHCHQNGEVFNQYLRNHIVNLSIITHYSSSLWSFWIMTFFSIAAMGHAIVGHLGPWLCCAIGWDDWNTMPALPPSFFPFSYHWWSAMEHMYAGTVQLPFPESESVLVLAEETLEETQVHTRTHRCEYKFGSLSTRRTRLPQNIMSKGPTNCPNLPLHWKIWECSTSSSKANKRALYVSKKS